MKNSTRPTSTFVPLLAVAAFAVGSNHAGAAQARLQRLPGPVSALAGINVGPKIPAVPLSRTPSSLPKIGGPVVTIGAAIGLNLISEGIAEALSRQDPNMATAHLTSAYDRARPAFASAGDGGASQAPGPVQGSSGTPPRSSALRLKVQEIERAWRKKNVKNRDGVKILAGDSLAPNPSAAAIEHAARSIFADQFKDLEVSSLGKSTRIKESFLTQMSRFTGTVGFGDVAADSSSSLLADIESIIQILGEKRVLRSAAALHLATTDGTDRAAVFLFVNVDDGSYVAFVVREKRGDATIERDPKTGRAVVKDRNGNVIGSQG